MMSENSHEVAFLFCKLAYQVLVSVRFGSSSPLTFASLFVTGAGMSFVSKNLLPREGRSPSCPLGFQLYGREVVKYFTWKGIVPLFLDMGNACAPRLGSLKFFPTPVVLDMVYSLMHTQDIPTEQERFPMTFVHVAIVTEEMEIDSVYAYIPVLHVRTNFSDDAVCGEHYLVYIAHHMMILAYTRTAVLKNFCHGAGLIKIMPQPYCGTTKFQDSERLQLKFYLESRSWFSKQA